VVCVCGDGEDVAEDGGVFDVGAEAWVGEDSLFVLLSKALVSIF